MNMAKHKTIMPYTTKLFVHKLLAGSMMVHSGDIDVSPGITYLLSMEVNVSINLLTLQ